MARTVEYQRQVFTSPEPESKRTLAVLAHGEGSNLTHMAAQLTQRWNTELWQRVAEIRPTTGIPCPSSKPARRRHYRLESQQRASLVRDYKAGASLGQVAKKYTVHIDTATRHVVAAGVPIRPSVVKIRTEDLPTIAQLHAEGWSYEAIGRKYGCTGLAVSKRLRSYEASLSES